MSQLRTPRLRLYALALASILAIAAAPAAQAQLSGSLTAQQVSCNEAQLKNLLLRLAVTGGGGQATDRPANLLVTYSNSYGFYEGLAVDNQSPLTVAPGTAVTPEGLLAFHINPSIRQLLLNPARPQLEQVSLEREALSSSFIVPGAAGVLNVTLNPTLVATPSADAVALINNLDNFDELQTCTGYVASSTKAGRGLTLAGLTTPCHTALTAQDRLVFSILERVLRVSVLGANPGNAEVAIYRGTSPNLYQVDVYPLTPAGGSLKHVAFELTINSDGAGRLTTGQVRLLPACSGGATSGCSDATVGIRLFLFAPVFSGTETRETGKPAYALTYNPGGGTPSPVAVDFAQLLDGTTWNGGF